MPRTETARYTHGHHEAVLRSHTNRTIANSGEYFAHLLTAGTDVLDVGCGPGTITVEMAQRVTPGRVVGIDPSAGVIDQATERADAAEVAVELRVASVYDLDPDAERFELVHAHQVLQHVAEPVAVLEAMAGLCRSGGHVAARDADYEAFTWHPHDPLLDDWLRLYREAARRNGAEPDAGRRLLAWAHAAGLDDVRATATVWCYSTAETRSWWGGLWADRITQTALADQIVEYGLADRDHLAAIAEAWHRWAASPDGWFLVPHGEILCQVE